jgi:Zn-dependent peptidase ImmA (M78 family)
MTLFDSLLQESPVPVIYVDLPKPLKGLYVETRSGRHRILLDKRMNLVAEKACVLAEELGHYHTSAGNILDQRDIRNRKQERVARQWAYEKLVPLEKIIEAYHVHICNRYELAEFLGVTEPFLQKALDRYREKYGLYVTRGRYTIYFDPLGVVEDFR